MNNKGFTLVEVLAVLVIVAIIGTIVSVNVFKMQKDNEINGYIANYENIKSNLELYNTDKKEEIWSTEDTIFVTFQDLKKVNQSLQLNDKCEIENMTITRNLYKENLYKYEYNVCIKCGENKDEYISSECN